MLLLRVLPDLQDKPADFESLLERLSEAARGELLAGRLEGSTAIMAVRLLLMAGTGRG